MREQKIPDEQVFYYDSEIFLAVTAFNQLPIRRRDKIAIGGGLTGGGLTVMCVDMAKLILTGVGYEKVEIDPDISLSLRKALG
ncbi:hypothetical protein ISS86_01565 [Candidatus Microgenomates bacterium]|nr:hypothetical protein [Candidatus Microgenomates bacterium]